MKTNKVHRPIHIIAEEIFAEWGNKVSYYARPYLEAMMNLDTVNDYYGFDTAFEIVNRFLSNATQYKGGHSKELKNELRSMVGLKLVR